MTGAPSTGATGSSAGVPRLSGATLDDLNPAVRRPTHDRSATPAGIVHIGVGGFHRAHMAMAIDSLQSQGLATDWSICGVGLLDSDRRMSRVMDDQDGLYTLIVKHPDGRQEARVIGSIVEYLWGPRDGAAILDRMAHPDTRIVSLTITEGGYNLDRATGKFDASNPAVAADLADGATPATVFGVVTEALRRRRERGVPGFTVLSCDNVQGNGHLASAMFSAFAELKDPGLAGWIRANVSFPNSMVDRITPVTAPEDIAAAQDRTGVRDDWPVVCEPFFQWVVEDDFPQGRPPFDLAGAQLVDDVEPYESMKLRLLNASHQALCYVGHLSGHRLVHEAMSDPLIVAFVRGYMDREATPTLRPVPGIGLDGYKDTLIERFSNPFVRDTIARLCADSSDRIPTWLVPVIREQLATGGEVALSAGIVASWARYAEGVDEDGGPIVVVDALRDDLIPLARSQHEHPLAFIENVALFGDLAENLRFAEAYTAALSSLHAVGARETLRALVGVSSPTATPNNDHPNDKENLR